jgi:hypothetical protein
MGKTCWQNGNQGVWSVKQPLYLAKRQTIAINFLPLQKQANKPTKHLNHQNDIDVVLLSIITQCIPHMTKFSKSRSIVQTYSQRVDG